MMDIEVLGAGNHPRAVAHNASEVKMCAGLNGNERGDNVDRVRGIREEKEMLKISCMIQILESYCVTWADY